MKNNLRKVNGSTATKNWFDRWSNAYDQTLGSISFHRGLLDLLVRNSRIKSGEKILDIGCGTGLLSLKFLKKSSTCSINGIDCSKEMLAIFQNKIKKLNLRDRVSVEQMDANALSFKDNTFDRVVSSVVLHHLTDKISVFKNIFRILKPGGVFIIGEIDMDTTGKHTDPVRLKRILRILEQEWICAMKDVGVEAFSKMFDNGKKHVLNDGEYCLSLKQWAGICRKAGFGPVTIKKVPHHQAFGIVIAQKSR